jgi:AcrR family transcriptional regulator
MPLVADQGTGFSLDELAANANVTRNLLYHYFPRGRQDILVAVAERSGMELTAGWVTTEAVPLEDRIAVNFARYFEHAMQPSDAWRVHRFARSTLHPELSEIVDRYEETVISGVSQNNLGTPDPPPLVRIALKAFIVFTETLLDQARNDGTPLGQVLAVVAETLPATVQAAVRAAGN